MANKYGALSLTNGVGALPGIDHLNTDGLSTILGTLDTCDVVLNSLHYTYIYDASSILEHNIPFVIKPNTNQGAGRWLLTSEYDYRRIVVPFAYGDATPLVLGDVLANKDIYSIEINILEVFNGVNPSLSIGVPANNSILVSIDENNPAEIGKYIIHPEYMFTNDTTVNLYITPGGGCTSGAGQIAIRTQ